MPTPAAASAGMPLPSSRTSTSSAPLPDHHALADRRPPPAAVPHPAPFPARPLPLGRLPLRPALRDPERDGAPAGAGMAHHVVQRLRDDPERRNLDRRGQLGTSDPGAIHGDGQAGRLQSSRELLDRPDQTELVERRGRRSCTSRRTSASTAATSAVAASSRRSASSGLRRARLRAVSIRRATAPRLGPRLSCRSRRSRRRSSSRAVTSCSGSTAARRSARSPGPPPRPAAPRRRAVAGRARRAPTGPRGTA